MEKGVSQEEGCKGTSISSIPPAVHPQQHTAVSSDWTGAIHVFQSIPSALCAEPQADTGCFQIPQHISVLSWKFC